MKTCSKCGIEKPETEYWFNKAKNRYNAMCRDCAADLRADWKERNKAKVAEKNRQWQLSNPERMKAAQQRWKERNPGIAAQRTREWRLANLDRSRENGRRNDQRLKDECYNAYGGYVCACCGETEPAFLTIDHINNDGAAHRRDVNNGIRRGGGKKIYSWLIANNFPSGFQILCMNCNWGKARNNGVCPHKTSEGSTTRRKP
jgi:hypothetical protein